MIAFGAEEPGGDTAMAKTVGLTAAAGVELMLGEQKPAGKQHLHYPSANCGRLTLSLGTGGVHIPTGKGVYEPVLEMLAAEGLGFAEESTFAAHE